MSISSGQQLIKMTCFGPHLVKQSAAMASQQFECPCCSELLRRVSVESLPGTVSETVSFCSLWRRKIVVVVNQKAFYLLPCDLTISISDQPVCLKIQYTILVAACFCCTFSHLRVTLMMVKTSKSTFATECTVTDHD